MKKIWLIFWWPSNEHEVSISSAKNIYQHIDKNIYELICIYRDKQGSFFKVHSPADISYDHKIPMDDLKNHIDIALLMTHGKYWEDGKLQSMLEVHSIPYCWCHVLSSALCMDKWVFKQFLQWYAINQVMFEILDFQLDTQQTIQEKIDAFIKKTSFPIYIKPANSWSSVGITKVHNTAEIMSAIQEAIKHDQRVILEQWLINPKEIEVAIIWNSDLHISEPGELILVKDFYDYNDKYKHNQSSFQIPANISDSQKKEIKDLATKIYKLCNCSGFARIDFFITEEKIYLNEINTLPGFTDISMFPMLMKHTGLRYSEIIDKIIALAY